MKLAIIFVCAFAMSACNGVIQETPKLAPVEWTMARSPFSDYSGISSITYGNGYFAACNEDGALAYSDDGIDWYESYDPPFSGSTVSSIIQGGNIWIAASRGGGLSYIDKKDLPYEPQWTPVGTSPDYLNALAYGGRTYIVCGDDGAIWYSSYASNPASWHKVAGLDYEGDFRCAYYDLDWFIAAGDLGSIFYSYDGETWFEEAYDTGFSESDAINGLAGDGYVMVAVGEGGTISYTDYDEDGYFYWSRSSRRGAFGYDDTIYGVVYGADKFIAFGDGGSMSYSSNGESWYDMKTERDFGGAAIMAGAYGEGLFVVGDEDGNLWYSNDQLAPPEEE